MAMRKIILRIYYWLTRLLYHQFAWAYDWVAALVSAGMWRAWVMTTLPYLRGASVLELGYGPGHLQAALLSRGIHAFGADLSPQMSRLAATRLRNKGISPPLVNARAQQLPFPRAAFDQVVSTFPAPYIYDPRTLQEIHRVLSPHGTLVILPGTTITSPQNIWEKLGSWFFDIIGLNPQQSDDYRVRLATPLQQAGFDVEIQTQPFKSSTVWIVLARPL